MIWDNVYVKKGARISDCVICNNVRVGQGAVLEEGVIVADETSIGDEAVIKRDVKIWPRKMIEAGATVTANLIWGEKWKKSLFEGAIIKGLSNVELTPEFVAKLGCAYGTTPSQGELRPGRPRLQPFPPACSRRCFVGGILSAGVNVRDMKMIPLPVLRYKLKTFGEVGGVHFRQAMDDPAATGDRLSGRRRPRLFQRHGEERGAHLSTRRTSAAPTTANRAPSAKCNNVVEFYREGFLRAIDREMLKKAACDRGGGLQLLAGQSDPAADPQ